MSTVGGAAGVPPASQRQWQQLALAGAVAAVLLLAAAGAAVRRPPLSSTAVHASAPAEPPACTADDLDGLLRDGELSWGTWEALVNATNSSGGGGSGSGAVPPPWRPPWLEAKSCTLRRFTPEMARKCLSGRPLVMIGDSVTRWVLPPLKQGLCPWMRQDSRVTCGGSDRIIRQTTASLLSASH